MRSSACILVVAVGLSACAAARPVVATLPAVPTALAASGAGAAPAVGRSKSKKERGPSDGAMLVRSALPFGDVKLDQYWQASAIVSEGPAGSRDTVEVQVAASDEDRVGLGIFIENAVEPGAGTQVTGRYVLRELVPNGPHHQLNVTIDGVLYGSVAGTVELEHRGRSIRGRFEAWVARDGHASNGAIAVSGSFAGRFGLGCFALDSGVPDPNAQGGTFPLEGEPAGTSWSQVAPSHAFCREYLDMPEWDEAGPSHGAD